MVSRILLIEDHDRLAELICKGLASVRDDEAEVFQRWEDADRWLGPNMAYEPAELGVKC